MSALEQTALLPATARASALDICEALIWLRREAEKAGLGRLAKSIGESIAAGRHLVEGGGTSDVR